MNKINIDLRNMQFSLSSVSELKNSALIPEVSMALLAWVRSKTGASLAPGVLIGGLALSFYCKPRYTQDVDLLFLRDTDIPSSVVGFKRNRPGAFTEFYTHVEVETCTSTSIGVPTHIVKKVIETAHTIDGLKVASLEGLVALKLFGSDNKKRELQDLADVVSLLANKPDVKMSDWDLSKDHLAKLEYARARI